MDTTTAPDRRLYFAYGSNLSSTQMGLRCPEARAVSLAFLPGWDFIINSRGVANVVRHPSGASTSAAPISSSSSSSSPDTGVYGVLYALSESDEDSLDRAEGVPWAYEKVELRVTKVRPERKKKNNTTDTNNDSSEKETIAAAGEAVTALVYVDPRNTTEGSIRSEYILRMGRAIEEAVKEWGLPQEYVEGVLRKSIPEVEGMG